MSPQKQLQAAHCPSFPLKIYICAPVYTETVFLSWVFENTWKNLTPKTLSRPFTPRRTQRPSKRNWLMLGRNKAVIQISQSYRGMLIKVNAYQALVWSSALLSFQKHCFNLANAALPFVILFRDCVVKHSAQATCCRSSRNCLQMSSLRC